MGYSIQDVKTLRERTGAGMMDCKQALEEAGGDLERAVQLLRERGAALAAKKATREAREGLIGSYVHAGGRIGVLVEVNCETDFVARTPDFQELVKDLAMQIAWSNPTYLRREEVPESVLEQEREVYRNQARQSGKPEAVIDRIVSGKLEKFFQEHCLLEQPFIKDNAITVGERIQQAIAKLGENIVVRRFVRYQLGETG